MAINSAGAATVVSAGSWTAPAGSLTANDGSEATITPAASNTDYPLVLGGFDHSSIPANAVLTNVYVRVAQRVNTVSNAILTAQVFESGVAVGAAQTITPTTTTTVVQLAPVTGVTLAGLRAGNVTVQMVARRANQSRTFWLDMVALDATWSIPNPKAETVTADFASADYGPDWIGTSNYGWDSGGGGRIRVTATSGMAQYSTFRRESLDLRDSYYFAKIAPPNPFGATTECILEIAQMIDDGFDAYPDPDNHVAIYLSVDRSTVYARHRAAAVNNILGSLSYSDSAHAYWMVEAIGSTTYLRAGPDGRTWSTIGTVATPSWADNVACTFAVGHYTALAQDDHGYLDNVNIPEPIPPGLGEASGQYNFTGTASGTKLASGAATGSWTVAGTAIGTAPTSLSGGSASGSWVFQGEASGLQPVAQWYATYMGVDQVAHQARARGWWDGATEQQVRLRGVWDGGSVVPVKTS